MKKMMMTVVASMLLLACVTNPLTGKKQLAITSEAALLPTSFQQYSEYVKEHKVVTNTADAQMVNEVGRKIKEAAVLWMTQKGYGEHIKPYQWEYKLIQDQAVNAWCMPGGKIAVFTGIIPVAKDESGLATVMGHEVAHALLAHSRSRLDAALLQQTGAQILGAVTNQSSEQLKKAFSLAYGIGTNLGALAYSRSHESEADQLGLILMTMAGYNPEKALDFWGRMSTTGGGRVPEFLSTHPSHNSRISSIKKWIPSAKSEAAKYTKVTSPANIKETSKSINNKTQSTKPVINQRIKV